MRIDVLAGMAVNPAALKLPRPTILCLDSGLGGLTVLRELRRARPDARFVYAADDAAFPYGAWEEEPLIRRVEDVVGRLIELQAPDLVVVACNTISTLVLPRLRARFDVPFIGTVPAIKPGALMSRTGRFAVLATPGTVRRDYTRALVETYAGSCSVDLVGSRHLAAIAEAELSGEPVPDAAIFAEIAPCFVDRDGRATDTVVLACTHYPLLLRRFRTLAPWPVTWIDPAPAIARRVTALIGEPQDGIGRLDIGAEALFTGTGRLTASLRTALVGYGLTETRTGICRLPAA